MADTNATTAAAAGGDASPPLVLESSEVTVMFITAALVSLILANATSTGIHRCGHDPGTGRPRDWVQSFPESMIVLTYGILVGMALLLVVTLASEGSDVAVVSEELLTAAIFQADTFNLVLLPIIIFTSGFTLKPKSLFFNLIFPILVLAIVGTLLCAAVIGGGVYTLMTVLPASPTYDVSIYTAMTYGSLLAAIDPVATLSIFVNLKVDPVLSMLLFGESVINDAVSIVLFDVFTVYATALPSELADLPVSNGFVLFFKSFFGSIGVALLVTLLSTLFLKFLKPSHEAQQVIVVFFFSYLSFEVADALYLSGITSSLFAGIFMGYLVPKNLSRVQTESMKGVFSVVAEMAESIVFFQIGVNSVISLNQMEQLWLTGIGVFVLCLVARLLAVPLQLWALNLCRRKGKKFTASQAVIMIHAGLRGAIAYALCLQFPVSAFRTVAVNITTFVILLSIFLIGPSTAPLLKCMKIRTNVPYEINHGRAYFSKWQSKFDDFARKHVVNKLSRGRSRSLSRGISAESAEEREMMVELENQKLSGARRATVAVKTYVSSVEDAAGGGSDGGGDDDESELEDPAMGYNGLTGDGEDDADRSDDGGSSVGSDALEAGSRASVESLAPVAPPRRRKTDVERGRAGAAAAAPGGAQL